MLPRYHRIPDAELDEFIAIYREEFGEEIGRTEAAEMASRVLMLYTLISRRLPEARNTESTIMRHDEDRPDNRLPIGFRT